jgi:hypothetical protein
MPASKIPSNFCLAWTTRKQGGEELEPTTNEELEPTTDKQVEPTTDERLELTTDVLHSHCDHPARIALTISKRILSRGKQKALLNMTSGLDAFALALTICREVRVFPVVVIHSTLILRSRIKGSFLIRRQNSGHFWLSECLVRCFISRCS